MSTKIKNIAGHAVRKKGPLSMEAMNHMVALFNGAQWDLLEAAARDATRNHPEHIFGWKALGKASLKSGKLAEAVDALTRAVKIAPNDPDAQNDLAFAFQHLARFEEAIAGYRRLLKLIPRTAPTHDVIGTLLCELGRFDEAEAEFRQALDIDPQYIKARINLGFVAGNLGRWNEAEACYRMVLEVNPAFAEAHRRLGDLLSKIRSRSADAIAHLEKAIDLNPADVGSIVTLGNVYLAENRIEESNALFRRARQVEPLITWPSKIPNPDFSVLLLDAPGAGSTPVNYLVGRTNYVSHFVGILPDVTHDIEFLRAKADVVINMIADADNGKEVLPLAMQLADALDRPTVNHPRKIMATDRESIARRLAGIPLCRIPKTVRLPAKDLVGAGRKDAIADFSLPLLIRCAGTHGGDDFEKVDNVDAIENFAARHIDTVVYISEFIDYRSTDGLFRKYRVICIDGQILPYHLAIHNDWMVHHFRTDMANQEWMRKEEEAFLHNMDDVFDKPHQDALRKIGLATGLDYCGIDCSLDASGNIVVFETNATMLVHDEKNATFAYKNPYIAKIKVAFDAMLEKMAGRR